MKRVGRPVPLFVVSCERNRGGALTVTPDLHIEILHNEITVTLPGTTYKVTYYKPRVIWYLSPSRLRAELRKAGALASLD